ncbi:hypothetical protein MR626_01440 [bacterium]|nr:hypothetical protein [bacterium]
MDILKTATGKKFDCDFACVLPEMGIAYFRIRNVSLAEIASVFSNPAETIQLWYNDMYIAQYSVLDALIPESGAIRVNLRRA